MPAGRPSLYRQEHAGLARNYCMLGATNDDLARLFDVGTTTIDQWIVKHDEFRCALKEGRDEADAKVASRLYSRASGYTHDAVKIVADAKTGAQHIVPYTEHYPPDTTACIFWLKNRRPDLWRDKHETEHTGKDGKDLIPPEADAAKVTLALLNLLHAREEVKS